MSGMHDRSGPVVEYPKAPGSYRPDRVLGRRRGAEPDFGRQGREARVVRDLAEIRQLLKRKLAWYGLRSAIVGPFRRRGDGTLVCDLLTGDGSILSCVSIDRRSGAVQIARDSSAADRIAALSVAISAAAAAWIEAPAREWHPMAGPHPTD
jgi:hypothetical protein